MNVIGTFWRATTRELIHIVWLATKKLPNMSSWAPCTKLAMPIKHMANSWKTREPPKLKWSCLTSTDYSFPDVFFSKWMCFLLQPDKPRWQKCKTAPSKINKPIIKKPYEISVSKFITSFNVSVLFFEMSVELSVFSTADVFPKMLSFVVVTSIPSARNGFTIWGLIVQPIKIHTYSICKYGALLSPQISIIKAVPPTMQQK